LTVHAPRRLFFTGAFRTLKKAAHPVLKFKRCISSDTRNYLTNVSFNQIRIRHFFQLIKFQNFQTGADAMHWCYYIGLHDSKTGLPSGIECPGRGRRQWTTATTTTMLIFRPSMSAAIVQQLCTPHKHTRTVNILTVFIRSK